MSTESGGKNPRDIKVALAKSIVSDFYSTAEASQAEEEFNLIFRRKQAPDDVEEQTVQAGPWKLAKLLVETGLAPSMGEARRLIEQGGVSVDGEKYSQTNSEVTLEPEVSRLIQVGKRRFLRIRSI
jgi:tyrosyl-tRNA synthetase